MFVYFLWILHIALHSNPHINMPFDLHLYLSLFMSLYLSLSLFISLYLSVSLHLFLYGGGCLYTLAVIEEAFCAA